MAYRGNFEGFSYLNVVTSTTHPRSSELYAVLRWPSPFVAARCVFCFTSTGMFGQIDGDHVVVVDPWRGPLVLRMGLQDRRLAVLLVGHDSTSWVTVDVYSLFYLHDGVCML